MDFNDDLLSLTSFEHRALNENVEMSNPGSEEYSPNDKSLLHRESRFY